MHTRAIRTIRTAIASAVVLGAGIVGLAAPAVTPAASAATCGTTNIALNHPATASSLENASFPASNAVDGNLATRWSSAFSDPQWLEVDLGSSQAICQVTLNWETAYATAFQIQTSTDGTTWANVYTTTTGPGGVAPDTWSIYRVANAPLVEPVAYQPIIVDSLSTAEKDQCRRQVIAAGAEANQFKRHDWQDCIGVPWFNDPSALDRPLVADGPSSWQHAQPSAALTATKRTLPTVAVTRAPIASRLDLPEPTRRTRTLLSGALVGFKNTRAGPPFCTRTTSRSPSPSRSA